ncbi:hypothetical protein [Anaerosinus massiliensis]|uniref:hypothetical protein n=1 Tax=Massilibacillus massiliensis TaxID=1806837 RepID=UPI000DA62A16|nr:hypothetical protein [Massilibacillus massiliensis]
MNIFKKINNKYIIAFVITTLMIIGVFTIYKNKNVDTKKVIYESQQQLESVDGIKEAANNAKVDMLQYQLEDAKKQIASLKNKQPDTIVKTVVKEVPVTVEKERQKSNADFAIITNPAKTDEKVDLSKYSDDQEVTLNQYNVHAYKKLLRQIDYAPKNIDDWSAKEIGYSVSKKISNDGKYLGVAVDHEFDDKKTTVKLRYTY